MRSSGPVRAAVLMCTLLGPATLATLSGCGNEEAETGAQAPADLRANLEASAEASGEAAGAPAESKK